MTSNRKRDCSDFSAKYQQVKNGINNNNVRNNIMLFDDLNSLTNESGCNVVPVSTSYLRPKTSKSRNGNTKTEKTVTIKSLKSSIDIYSKRLSKHDPKKNPGSVCQETPNGKLKIKPFGMAKNSKENVGFLAMKNFQNELYNQQRSLQNLPDTCSTQPSRNVMTASDFYTTAGNVD